MKLFDRLGKLRDRRRPYCTMIVPAAGESRRMGGGNKLLLPLEGEPVLAAALEANEKARLIAVHDGARPLIRPEQIDELIRFGERTYAAAPAVPVSDTIKRTEPSTGRVLETPDRAALFAVQTPQVFQAELLKAALQSAVNAEVTLTDDCSAVERLGKEVYLTAGDPENIKITRPLDLRLAEAILAERRKQA